MQIPSEILSTLIFLLTTKFSTKVGESFEWQIYLSLLLILPLDLLIKFFKKIMKESVSEDAPSFIFFGILLVACGCTLQENSSLAVLKLNKIIGLSSFLAVASYFTFFVIKKKSKYDTLIFNLVLMFLFALPTTKLIWWVVYRQWVVSNSLVFFVALGTLGCFCYLFLKERKTSFEPTHKSKIYRFIQTTSDLIALTAIGIFSFSPGKIFSGNESALHHLSYFLGPLELLKNNHSLLYSVPSQYGFLNIFLLSKIKTVDTWQTFIYFTQAINLLYGLCFFYVVRAIFRKSLFNSILISALTIFVIFCLPGWAPELSGNIDTPSVSGFRFFPSFFVLFLIFVFERNISIYAYKKKILILIHFFSAVGILWSIESAIYTLSVWAPFVIGLSFIKFQTERAQNNIQMTFLNIAKNICYLGVFLVVILIFTINNFSYFDPFAFIEYALQYSSGFGALPIQLNGSVWIILILFLLLTTLVSTSFITSFSLTLFSTYYFMWSTTSYFVSRSHENNITNLLPIYTFSILIGYHYLKTYKLERLKNFKKTFVIFCILFLSTLFLAVLGNLNFLQKGFLDRLSYPVNATMKADTSEKPTPVDENSMVFKYLYANGFVDSDAVSYLSYVILRHPAGQTVKYWLPTAPMGALEILSSERIDTYVRRFALEAKVGGWLIYKKSISSFETYNLFEKKLSACFSLVSDHSNEVYVLRKFRYKNTCE